LDQLVQVRLVNWQLPGPQILDLRFVDVDARNTVAEVCQGNGVGQPDVARPDDGDLQVLHRRALYHRRLHTPDTVSSPRARASRSVFWSRSSRPGGASSPPLAVFIGASAG